MTVLVVCLGNELVGDDGVGIRVGKVLSRLPLPSDVELVHRPNLGLELIDLLGDYERIILVDAMTTGRQPGTCEVIEVAEAAGMAACPTCSHSIGIPEILQMARRLHPARAMSAIRIVGVEGQSMDEFGVGLSEPVRGGLIRAVDVVLEAVGASVEQRAAGRAAAEAESARTPSIADVLGATLPG